MAWLHLLPPAFSTCFQLSLVLILCLFLRARVDAQDRKPEIRILMSFKEASILDYGDQLYWNYWKETDANPCAWVGVTCTDNATVWELDFSSWGINSVPGLEILSKLPDLRQLDLSYNYLTDLPETIGMLTRLTLLDLSGNNINGSIPANISACTSLRLLLLPDNYFSGEIFNISTLVHLQVLDLSYNQFSGTFPDELVALTSLDSLDLSNNYFRGRIPDLRNLTDLFYLNLSANSFEGFEQHWSLGEKSTLNQFDVSFNLLEGVIPPTLPHKLNLTWLDLSTNRLSGGIPPGMLQSYTTVSSSSSSCSYLNLSNNLLTGSLPMDGVKDSCFDVLDLSYNNLTGGLLRKFFHFIPVNSYFGIQNNQFSGDLLNVLVGTGWHYTLELRIQDNLFTGDLSRIVKNHTEASDGLVQILDLRNNYLGWSTSTAIPDPIAATLESFGGLFGGLLELRLGGNNFSGTSLPSTCFQANKALGQNSLSVLDLSSSHLRGEISSEVFQSSCVPSLQYLNLSNNDLTGQVPESIILLPNLTVLDLSVNHLSGSLPNISLRSSLFNPSFYQDNDGLCGYPLRECPTDVGGTSVSWWQLLIIIMGSLTIALGSCLVATWRWRVYHKRHQQDADLIKTLMERDSAILMSLRELKKATNNFATAAQIGEGGYGTVYAGTLDDGTIVAIKRSKREGHENDKQQFLNEVRILSHVNHRNLVKLIGCCMENKVSLLVFEFVSNGTLQEHLRGKVGDARLSWKQRIKIAVQTADALNYLHSATKFPIYHRDVKSANILLDENLNAKVADFGISKLASIEATHVSTVGMGTMGYVDPEYYISYQLTNKSDVYSFGVVVLELISAKHVIDAERGEFEASLVIHATRHINSGDLQQFIDPSLTQVYNDPSGQGKESILNVGRLAMKCLDFESKARPSMIEVLKELHDLLLELDNTSMPLDSIHEDDEEDSSHDNVGLLSRRFSSNSYDYSKHTAGSSIEMSRFTRSVSCR